MTDRAVYRFEVIAAEDEIKGFAALMGFINECRYQGHHGIVTLHVDGDGSARMSCYESGKEIRLPKGMMEELDNKDIWIGE